MIDVLSIHYLSSSFLGSIQARCASLYRKSNSCEQSGRQAVLSYALVGQGAMLENSKRVGNGGQAITQRVGGGRGG